MGLAQYAHRIQAVGRDSFPLRNGFRALAQNWSDILDANAGVREWAFNVKGRNFMGCVPDSIEAHALGVGSPLRLFDGAKEGEPRELGDRKTILVLNGEFAPRP